MTVPARMKPPRTRHRPASVLRLPGAEERRCSWSAVWGERGCRYVVVGYRGTADDDVDQARST
jgi:hypothetical protein